MLAAASQPGSAAVALTRRPAGAGHAPEKATRGATLGRVRQVAGSLALGLALYICIFVSRVFLVGQILGSLIPLRGVTGIAWIAFLGGAVPALVLGFSYGLLRERRVLRGALAVATIACALELAISSANIPWWNFITWWVLPLECITVLVVFSALALAGSRALHRVRAPVRFRLGVGLFVLLTLGALAWPWLYNCIQLNKCQLVP